ncbi:MAG: hypothetical protein ACRDRK_19490 [Pseudonocardia sp.]
MASEVAMPVGATEQEPKPVVLRVAPDGSGSAADRGGKNVFLSTIGDPRDRLLALLLPNAERAVAIMTEADRAREAVHRARRELEIRSAELEMAADKLIAQGLSSAQVGQLLGLDCTELDRRRRDLRLQSS